MADYLEITTVGDVPTGAIPASMLAAVRNGPATATESFRLWQARLGTEPGPTVARNIHIEPLYRYTLLSAQSRTVEAAIRQWMQIRFPGTVVDPTGGTSGGEPWDYAPFATDGWIPMGADSPFFDERLVMPPQFARPFDLRMQLFGYGEDESIAEVALKVTSGQGVFILPIYSFARHGEQLLVPGSDAYNALMRARHLQGWQLRIGVTDDTALLVEEMTFWLNRFEDVYTSTFETTPFSLTAGDAVVLDGTAGKQEYRILVARLSTVITPGVGGFAFIKGDAASTNAGVLPPLPAGYVPLGSATRSFPLATPLSNIDTIDFHALGGVYKGPASPTLAVRVGPRMTTLSGALQIQDSIFEIDVTDNATSYVNADYANTITIDATPGGAGKEALAQVVAAAGNITSIVQLHDFRAPNTDLSTRDEIVREVDLQQQDHDGKVWVFGRALSQVSGTVDGIPTGMTLLDVGGHYILGQVTTFAAYGILRVGDGVGQASINDAGANVVGDQEDIVISAMRNPATVGDYAMFRSTKRWGGSGANEPDVDFASVAGLDVDLTLWAAELETWQDRPFQIRYLDLTFRALTSLAQFRLRIWKVGRNGVEALVDTGTLSGFHGTPTVARAFKQITRTRRIAQTAGAAGTLVPWRNSPTVCRIDPFEREGIFGYVDEILDMGHMELRLGINGRIRP